MRPQTVFATVVAAALLSVPPSVQAESLIATLSPTSFAGANDGPFYLDFTLTGTAGNTVDLTGFSFGGGSAVEGTETPTNGASGSFAAGIMLNDSSTFYNDFYQQFNPGKSLSFTINMTNINSSTPDTLTLALLDSTLLPIPTLDPTGAETLFTIDLGSSPSISSYAGDTSQSTSDLTYPVIAPATFAAAPTVPESPTLAYGIFGLAACLMFARRRLATAAAVVFSLAAAASSPAATCQPISATAASPILVASGREATGVASADFDGDGIPDMAVGTDTGTSSGAVLAVYKGDGTGGFSLFGGFPVTLSSTLMNGGNVFNIVAADFNHDGKMDLLVSSDTGSVFVATGNGNGSFNVPASAALTIPTGSRGITLEVADLNGDGYPDVVTLGEVTTVILNTNGTLAARQLIIEGLAWLGDVNGDGYPDLVAGSGKIYINNTHGSFAAETQTISFSAADIFQGVLGDFNGDGKIDFLFVGINSSGTGILYQLFTGDGTGNFTAGALENGFTVPSFTEFYNVVAGDFNGDGRLDFAFSQRGNSTGNLLYIYEGTSAGGFTVATGSPFQLGINSSTAFVATADINADGRADLVATSRDTSLNGNVYVFITNSQSTSIGLSTSANPGVTGASLTLTAVVGNTSSCAVPTGTVSFRVDNGAAFGATLLHGQATTTLSSGLTAGVHTIKATYPGDGNFGQASVEYVEFIGSSTCSPNLTAQFTVKPGGFVYDRAHQQFVQTVSITNNGPGAITGPVSLALDALSSNSTLASPAGYTSCATPANSPMADTGICPGNPLASGGTVSFTMRFNDPTLTAISYTPRVLGGLALR